MSLAGFPAGTDKEGMTSTSRANFVLACAAVTCDSENQLLVTSVPFQSRQGKGLAAVGWAGAGWNVNAPWLVQSRLVAIFGRDPGEVQARSRRDHKTIQIPSPVLVCVSSTVFSAHFVSLFQSFRSRAGYKCLPA